MDVASDVPLCKAPREETERCLLGRCSRALERRGSHEDPVAPERRRCGGPLDLVHRGHGGEMAGRGAEAGRLAHPCRCGDGSPRTGLFDDRGDERVPGRIADERRPVAGKGLEASRRDRLEEVPEGEHRAEGAVSIVFDERGGNGIGGRRG